MKRRPVPVTHDGFKLPIWKEFAFEKRGFRVNLRFVPNLTVWLPRNHDVSLTKLCVGTSRPFVELRASKSVMNRNDTALAVCRPIVASSIFVRPYRKVL